MAVEQSSIDNRFGNLGTGRRDIVIAMMADPATGKPITSRLTPKGYQQIANTTLATAQSLAIPNGADMAVIQNNGSQPVRYRDDGTPPTASLGQRINSGDSLTYAGDLSAIRFIREADGTMLDILYYS